MAHQNSRKNWIMIVIGVLSIIGLLSYTWIHSGNLLASYVNPPFVGFLAAFGIELSIVGTSLRIGDLKKSGLDYRFFGFTLIAVVAVSAIANIAEGFMVKYGEPLTISNFGKLDLVEAFVLFAVTGLISLITLALSEIIGQDVIKVEKNSKKTGNTNPVPGGYTIVANEEEEISAPAAIPQIAPALDKLYLQMSQETFNDRMMSLGADAPKSVSQVEGMFNLSHATAGRLLKKYREDHVR
jgi:hypothetical protein